MKHNVFENPIHIFKLNNGLTVHLIPTNSFVTYAQLDIPIGGLTLKYEKNQEIFEVIPGSAHFLEHKIFATKEGDGFQKLSNFGVSANAMTSYRNTSYTLNGTDNVLNALIYLINMLEEPFFTKENVNSERKIINEEIQMYDDDPDTLIDRKLYSQLLHQHPLLHDILGTKSDISKISKETLLQLHQHFYLNKDRQLYVMGPIDIKLFEETLKNEFHEVKYASEVKIISENEPYNIKLKEDTIYLDVYMPSLSIGFKIMHQENDYYHRFKKGTLMSFLMRLLFGKQSLFAEKMLKRGIMYDSFTMDSTNEEDLIIYILDVNTQRYMELKTEVQHFFFNEVLNDLKKETFDGLKKAYLGGYVMELDDIESKLYLYSRFNYNKLKIEDVLEIIKNITFEEMINLYHEIKEDMISYLITLPKNQS